jgi:hypothetical protein
MTASTIQRASATSSRGAVFRGLLWREVVLRFKSGLWAPGIVLGTALFAREIDGSAPVLQRDSIFVAKALLPLAFFALIESHLASTRDERTGAAGMLSVLPTPEGLRRWARATAGTVEVLLGGLAAVAMLAWLATREAATGRPNVAEIAAGVLLIALASLAGHGLARIGRSPAVPAVAVAGISLLTVMLAGDGRSRAAWWGPFVDFATRNDAVELAHRPAGAHLLYLAGLAALAVAALSGAVRRAVLPVVIGCCLVVGAGLAQQRPARALVQRRAMAWATSAPATQVCRNSRAVTACVFRGYEGWLGAVMDTGNAVLSRLPQAVEPVRIQQRLERLPQGTYPPAVALAASERLSAAVPADVLSFGMSGLTDGTKTELRLALGAHAVGLPLRGDLPDSPQLVPGGPRPSPHYCDASDEARSVTAMWLALGSDEAARHHLRALVDIGSGSEQANRSYPILIGGAVVSRADAALALSLDESSGRSLLDHWQAVMSPSMTRAELAAVLDVPVPEASTIAPTIAGPAVPCR